MQRKVVGREAAGDVMHAPVHAKDIAEKLNKRAMLNLAPEDVLLDQPLTTYGTHTVPIRVGDFQVDTKVFGCGAFKSIFFSFFFFLSFFLTDKSSFRSILQERDLIIVKQQGINEKIKSFEKLILIVKKCFKKGEPKRRRRQQRH